MSFTTFSPTKFTRQFIAPLNSQKPAGAARHPHGARAAAVKPVHRKGNPSAENLKHAPETVGHIMTGDYVTVDSTMSAGSALEKVRVLAHVVLRIYTIYVTGPDNRLDGVLTLRDLLISDPTAPLSQIMAHPRVCITTDTAQERAAKIMATQDIDEIPVIDQAASLVGVVTAKAVATAQ